MIPNFQSILKGIKKTLDVLSINKKLLHTKRSNLIKHFLCIMRRAGYTALKKRDMVPDLMELLVNCCLQ